MRIVLEMTKNAEPEAVLRDRTSALRCRPLSASTCLRWLTARTAHLTLKQALRVYVEHRISSHKRRAEFDLKKPSPRAYPRRIFDRIKESDELIGLSAAHQTLKLPAKN
ncbi:hypothetical protein [Candidatus Villigracilis affinis]|uniref:hypothetical protein n=1 Tax=Candidatus Villigracilis affinis TaxID=3140682 RepID=UPI001E02141C|nr:hypothetical protein [Anaerolineales bacterium]